MRHNLDELLLVQCPGILYVNNEELISLLHLVATLYSPGNGELFCRCRPRSGQSLGHLRVR